MKVENSNKANITSKPKKVTREELEAKLEEKFGKIKKVKKPVEDKVEVSSNKKDHTVSKAPGDMSNNPESVETREKLKEILKTGAFEFNEGERKALANILK